MRLKKNNTTEMCYCNPTNREIISNQPMLHSIEKKISTGWPDVFKMSAEWLPNQNILLIKVVDIFLFDY